MGNPGVAAPETAAGVGAVLSVADLEVRTGQQVIVSGISFDVQAGEVVAVVGESGSGKSTVCHAVIDLLGTGLRATRGRVLVDGQELGTLPAAERRMLRGRRVGMVFQDPLASLNPVRTIGYQLAESRVLHGLDGRRAARAWARGRLAELGFDDPDAVLRAYPHMLSGGMRQRVCIAIAFSAAPRLVIADEPTSSLDVSLQGRILRLLRQQAADDRSGLVIVSHDIKLVGALADTVLVLYGGRMLERGPAARVLGSPRSPYTAALRASVPSLDPATRGRRLATIPGEYRRGTERGCPFRSRCRRALDRCADEFPGAGHDEDAGSYWCWNPEP